MNRTWTGCIFFALGAAGGALAARRFFEEKYARIAQEEIDSVKAAFARREKPAREEPAASGKEKTDYRTYVEALSYAEKAEEPPIELPPRAGFTNTGYPPHFSTTAASSSAGAPR